DIIGPFTFSGAYDVQTGRVLLVKRTSASTPSGTGASRTARAASRAPGASARVGRGRSCSARWSAGRAAMSRSVTLASDDFRLMIKRQSPAGSTDEPPVFGF